MKDYIKRLKDIACERMANTRFRGLSQDEQARLRYELKLIEKTGTASQFSDIIAAADKAAEQGEFYALARQTAVFYFIVQTRSR